MKKIFLYIIIFSFTFIKSAQSDTVGKYLNDKKSEYSAITIALERYVHAVGVGIFWNLAVSDAKKIKTFCPPKNWSPSGKDFLNYIDSEIEYAKKNNLYNDNDKIAFYMSLHLYRIFPCK